MFAIPWLASMVPRVNADSDKADLERDADGSASISLSPVDAKADQRASRIAAAIVAGLFFGLLLLVALIA
jgi:hypothetical protein